MRAGLFVSAVVALFACDDGVARDHQLVERAPVPGVGRPDAGEVVPDATSVSDTGVPADEVVDATIDSLADTADDTTIDVIESADTADTSMVDTDTSIVDSADTTETDVTPPEPIGTPADPIRVSHFPFVVSGDTASSPSDQLDRYACAAATDESGPERVYRLDLTTAGTLVAEVDEAAGVDVDLHLLTADPALVAMPSAVPCLARDNTRLVAEVTVGTYWLVIDTYVAAAGPKAGAYRVAIEHLVVDAFQTVSVAPGILWKQKIYSNYAGGRQTINVLDVDLTNPSVSIRPHGGDGCIRPSRTAPTEGAIAAINAGFFDTGPGTCPPLDLIKIEGEVVSFNHLTGAAQRSVGIDPTGQPIIAWVDANTDWPAAWSAIGSYPSLVTDGAVAISPDKDTDFFDGRHPRTALGLTSDNHVLLVTVEGRGPAGIGMTLAQLAQHLLNLGAVQGVNLDGGGSTAMWIANQSLTGVVNFPSDGDGLTHTGERSVSDLLLVFSTP